MFSSSPSFEPFDNVPEESISSQRDSSSSNTSVVRADDANVI